MIKIGKTFTAQIYMAGDIAHAKQIIRRHAMTVGLCVTVEPVDFIYKGGEETGFRIGLINYPRFPSTREDITKQAHDLATILREALGQHSFSIVMPDVTTWNTIREGQSEATL